MRRMIAFSGADAEAAGSSLSVMSYNVGFFNWYASDDTLEHIFNTIREARPDILCFQDYFFSPHLKNRRKLDSFRLKMGYKYRYENISRKVPKTLHTGMALYSKYPIFNVTVVPIVKTGSNGAFYADVRVGNDTFRVFNIHLQSVGLRENEYTITGLEQSPVSVKSSFSLSLKKLRRAFRRRSVQVAAIKEQIALSPYPVILCGDFNDTPGSYAYAQLNSILDDSFLSGGNGLGTTFAGKLPFLRIDYVLNSPSFTVMDSRVIKEKGSDHYPVLSRFELNK